MITAPCTSLSCLHVPCGGYYIVFFFSLTSSCVFGVSISDPVCAVAYICMPLTHLCIIFIFSLLYLLILEHYIPTNTILFITNCITHGPHICTLDARLVVIAYRAMPVECPCMSLEDNHSSHQLTPSAFPHIKEPSKKQLEHAMPGTMTE